MISMEYRKVKIVTCDVCGQEITSSRFAVFDRALEIEKHACISLQPGSVHTCAQIMDAERKANFLISVAKAKCMDLKVNPCNQSE